MSDETTTRPDYPIYRAPGERVLVTVNGERVAATVKSAPPYLRNVYVKLDVPVVDAEFGGREIWHVYRDPADVETIPSGSFEMARDATVGSAVLRSDGRTVLRSGWIRAADVREGDLVWLEASEQTRHAWREVIETRPIEEGDPLRRWGEVYVRVRIRWVEKDRVSGGADESPYEDDSWVSTILPAEKIVEVLVGPEPVA